MIDRATYLEEQLLRQIQLWITRVLILGIILFLFLGIMDYFVTPENFKQFLIYRLSTSSTLALFCYLNTLKRNRYYQTALIISTVIVSAITIELMILSFDRHESSYYAGINLLIIAVMGLIPVGPLLSILLAAIIYTIYIIPLLILDNITHLPYFIASNFFIFSTFAIALTLRFIGYKSMLNELVLQYELAEEKGKLEKYSTHLEDLVAERTKELTVSEQRFRELFDNANDGIAVIDKNGLIVNVNNKFCELHNFVKNALTGVHFGLIEAKNHNGEKEERIKRILNGEPLVYETEHYKKDGSTILLEVSSKAINIGGELYIQSFHRDITEKKQLEEQLFQSQKMESIGTLAGGIAHDFNNILTAILGHTELLHYCEGLDDRAKQSLRIVENSARKAGQIVSKLLSFSRKASFEILPVNLNSVIKDTVELCETMSSKRNVNLKMDINYNIPFVYADHNHLEQVLMNLFVNAMDAMPNGGNITITTELLNLEKMATHVRPLLNPGNYVVMKVTDTGTGISDEIRNKIFNPFFTTKEPGKGTGLGLAMVYGIIKEHKGIVDVKSTLGKGTTFEIYLPASDSIISAAAKISASSAAGGIRILVVDDEEDILNFIKAVLEKEGYRLIITSDPNYAMEMFSEFANNIDIVITDIIMPLLDGKTLIKNFKAIKPTIKTIAISAHDTHSSGDKNIDTFIKKPFEGADLLSRIRKVLGSENSAFNMN